MTDRRGRRRATPREPKRDRVKRFAPYRSGYEYEIAQQLKALGILDPETGEVPYETLRVPYTVPESVHTYTPDFVLTNGTRRIIIEAKGNFTSVDRKKMMNVIASNPSLDIRMLLMRDNRLSKTSRTTYSQWCLKRGIPCAVGKIPAAWISELDKEETPS